MHWLWPVAPVVILIWAVGAMVLVRRLDRARLAMGEASEPAPGDQVVRLGVATEALRGRIEHYGGLGALDTDDDRSDR